MTEFVHKVCKGHDVDCLTIWTDNSMLERFRAALLRCVKTEKTWPNFFMIGESRNHLEIYDFILIRFEALLKRMVISIWKEQYRKARRIVIKLGSASPRPTSERIAVKHFDTKPIDPTSWQRMSRFGLVQASF
jgi:hypothetical protein